MYNEEDLCRFLDLEFFAKFFFPNSNVTRGHTFKIKSSYSQALSPACGALVFYQKLKCVAFHMKNAFYPCSWIKSGRRRSKIRLHVLCSLILIFVVHRRYSCWQMQYEPNHKTAKTREVPSVMAKTTMGWYTKVWVKNHRGPDVVSR